MHVLLRMLWNLALLHCRIVSRTFSKIPRKTRLTLSHSFQNPLANTSNLASNQVLLALWYLPMAIAGLVCCVLVEPLLHTVNMKMLLLITGLLWIAGPVILSVSPLPLNYWANAFPSVLCATAGINLTFTISIVYLTAVQPAESQGLCGAMCSIFLGLAFAFSLPIGQIVMTKVSGTNWMIDAPIDEAAYDADDRSSMILGYRAAFIYAAVSAGLGLILCLFGVSIPKALRVGKEDDEVEDDRRSNDAETQSL
jgi:MFS family permease